MRSHTPSVSLVIVKDSRMREVLLARNSNNELMIINWYRNVILIMELHVIKYEWIYIRVTCSVLSLFNLCGELNILKQIQ